MRHNQWRVAQAWTTQEQKKIQLREAILHHIGILPSHLEKEHKKKGKKKKKKREEPLEGESEVVDGELDANGQHDAPERRRVVIL